MSERLLIGGPADGKSTSTESTVLHVPVLPAGATLGVPHFQRAVYVYVKEWDHFEYTETLPCALCVQEGWA